MMSVGASNITIRVEDDTKQQFDAFCEKVGTNMSTAINMFIKSVLRTRELPFTVTDVDPVVERAKLALASMQAQAVINGTSKMTMEEIDAEIAAARRERRERELSV